MDAVSNLTHGLGQPMSARFQDVIQALHRRGRNPPGHTDRTPRHDSQRNLLLMNHKNDLREIA
jgi:hypothetical protein